MIPSLTRATIFNSYKLVTAVIVDFNQEQDIPLFKKYAVMNSGLVQSERYNDSVIESFGLIRVSTSA